MPTFIRELSSVPELSIKLIDMQILIFFTFIYHSSFAFACESLPKGFSFSSIRLTMEYKKDEYRYKYYLHFEFPDLNKVCWKKEAEGTLAGGLPGEFINIRGSTLDEKDGANMDLIPADNIKIANQPDNRFVGLQLLAPSLKYSTQVLLFYSSSLNFYLLSVQNLYTVGSTSIVRVEVINH